MCNDGCIRCCGCCKSCALSHVYSRDSSGPRMPRTEVAAAALGAYACASACPPSRRSSVGSFAITILRPSARTTDTSLESAGEDTTATQWKDIALGQQAEQRRGAAGQVRSAWGSRASVLQRALPPKLRLPVRYVKARQSDERLSNASTASARALAASSQRQQTQRQRLQAAILQQF